MIALAQQCSKMGFKFTSSTSRKFGKTWFNTAQNLHGLASNFPSVFSCKHVQVAEEGHTLTEGQVMSLLLFQCPVINIVN